MPGLVKVVNSQTGTHDDRTTICALACRLLQGETRVGHDRMRWMRRKREQVEAEPPKVESVNALAGHR